MSLSSLRHLKLNKRIPGVMERYWSSSDIISSRCNYSIFVNISFILQVFDVPG
jgi:hypothetical protein